MFTLSATKLLTTFGGIARSYVMQAVCLSPKRVDIGKAFNDYPTSSIKDCKMASMIAKFSGRSEPGPAEKFWQRFAHKILASPMLTSSVIMISTWDFVTIVTYHFYVLDGQMIRKPIEDMVTIITNHEEVNILICFHAKCIDDTGGAKNK